jgi:hypothetical protein
MSYFFIVFSSCSSQTETQNDQQNLNKVAMNSEVILIDPNETLEVQNYHFDNNSFLIDSERNSIIDVNANQAIFPVSLTSSLSDSSTSISESPSICLKIAVKNERPDHRNITCRASCVCGIGFRCGPCDNASISEVMAQVSFDEENNTIVLQFLSDINWNELDK